MRRLTRPGRARRAVPWLLIGPCGLAASLIGLAASHLGSDSTSRAAQVSTQTAVSTSSEGANIRTYSSSQAPSDPASAAPTSAKRTTSKSRTALPTAATTNSAFPARIRPRIWWHPIPFGAKRLAETAAYALRHYGVDTWRLAHPRMIVEHYTESNSWQSAWSLFSQDVPDSELHELPGTCAHFIVTPEGRIIQLVKTSIICRHTVGLNWAAIGVENVGMSDHDILANPRELNASLRLTAYLMAKYHIAIGNVIGHNESLESRYHHELDPAWRCQTHQDWQHPDMQGYRRDLANHARREAIPLGRGYQPMASGCG
jgi:N-acetylmuramoyl-L-alanine amidase